YFSIAFDHYTALLKWRLGSAFKQGGRKCCTCTVGLLCEPFLKRLVEPLPAVRLQQVIYRVRFKCTYGIFIESSCKNNSRRLLDKLQHFKSVDFGHLDIEENKIGLMLHNRFYALKSIAALFGHRNLVVVLQVFFYYASCQWFIVYYEHLN